MPAPNWPIRTERLLLRPFEPDDLAALHAIHSDELVVRWPGKGCATEGTQGEWQSELGYAILAREWRDASLGTDRGHGRY